MCDFCKQKKKGEIELSKNLFICPECYEKYMNGKKEQDSDNKGFRTEDTATPPELGTIVGMILGGALGANMDC